MTPHPRKSRRRSCSSPRPRSPLEETIVAQAVAVLAHVRRLPEPDALRLLRRYAGNQRRPLAEVALGMRPTPAWKRA